MGQTGLQIIGDQLVGFTEVEVIVVSDIPADLYSERQCYTPIPTIERDTFRYISTKHIQSIYINRFVSGVYDLPESTDRSIYVHYRKLEFSDRTCSFHPDGAFRWIMVESLLTATPMILKYPKYYNWNAIPQIINPKFQIWSFYKLDLDSITIHITTDLGKNIYENSGLNPEKFEIEQSESNKNLWNITVHIDEVFDNNEELTVYVSMYDEKGNNLLDGLF